MGRDLPAACQYIMQICLQTFGNLCIVNAPKRACVLCKPYINVYISMWPCIIDTYRMVALRAYAAASWSWEWSTASQLDCHSASCRSSHISITRPVVCGGFYTPNCRTPHAWNWNVHTHTTGMCQRAQLTGVRAHALACKRASVRAQRCRSAQFFAAGVLDTVTSHARACIHNIRMCVCVCLKPASY